MQQVLKEIDDKNQQLVKQNQQEQKEPPQRHVTSMIPKKEKVYKINPILFAQILLLVSLLFWGQIRFFLKDIIIIVLAFTIWANLNSSYDSDKNSKTLKILNPHENLTDEEKRNLMKITVDIEEPILK